MKRKQLLATSLALAMIIGMTGCDQNKNGAGDSKKNGGASQDEVPEFTYIADHVMLSSGGQGYADSENVLLTSENVYMLSADTSNGAYQYSICRKPIESDKVGESQEIVKVGKGENCYKFTVDQQGNVYMVLQEFDMGDAGDYDMNGFDADAMIDELPADGNAGDEGAGADENAAADENAEIEGSANANAVTISEEEGYDPDGMYYDNWGPNSSYKLVKYSPSGELLYETDLTPVADTVDWFYPQYLLADDKGRVYIYASSAGFLLFDENGKSKGKIELNADSWVSAAGLGKDGKLLFSNYSYDGNSGGYTLSEAEFDSAKVVNTYKNFVGAYGSFSEKEDGTILVRDESYVYEYSKDKQEAQKVLNWVDCDIDGNSVGDFAANGEDYLAVSVDRDTNDMSLAFLKKVKTADVVQKEILTLGMLYDSSMINRQIIQFNKTSDKYRIRTKTYFDVDNWSDSSYQDAIDRLNNDILSGNCPDILDLSNLDIVNLASKGVLEDLNPYLEKSTKFSKEDFFDGIIKGATVKDKLIYLPTSFTLETLAGKASVVGDKRGWTLTDLIELSRKYPGADLLEYGNNTMVLQIMMMLNQDHFINSETGECKFDSPEFKELLEFAKTFPSEYDDNGTLAPFRLKDNTLLLADASIYSYNELQSVLSYFGDEKVTFVGYPCYDDSNGCVMTPMDSFAISAKSQHKDAAWEFLESRLATRIDEPYGMTGFPSTKKEFEAQAKDAMEVKYVLDENGEKILDEDGEPIYENGGTWGMSGEDGQVWTVKMRPTTQAEVDLVRELLDNSRCVNINMDNQLYKILEEECESYFKGGKSVDEVASIIQSRVNLYVKENK